tara:strand:+ start:89 stop:832 length:744 start_codon:yes stop_codon:yes gene_type:complete
MADSKITALTELTSVAGEDLVAIVDDPSGTPTSKKITKANLVKNIAVSDLANGTDGELITWNSSGVASAVPVGTATNVLTSNGAGQAPTFQAAGAGGLATSDLSPYIVVDLLQKSRSGTDLSYSNGVAEISVANDSTYDETNALCYLDWSKIKGTLYVEMCWTTTETGTAAFSKLRLYDYTNSASLNEKTCDSTSSTSSVSQLQKSFATFTKPTGLAVVGMQPWNSSSASGARTFKIHLCRIWGIRT